MTKESMMISLPIPMISALILGALLVRLWITDRRHGPLAMLLAICAAQGFIISLAQHYGVLFAAALQPVTASLIPPMAWIAFQATAVRGLMTKDVVHIAGPVAVLAALPLWLPLLDLLIPALFAGYGFAIIWQSRKGADALPRMRLEAGDLPALVWTTIGAALVASALSDAVIVMAQIGGFGTLQPLIVSITSTTTLALIGGLTLSGALVSEPSEAEDAPAPRVADAQDAQIMEQLERYMKQAQPYLNPDLTMSQLSRKMHIPVKQLSGAINRVTGENASRYINSARIGAAQQALRAGENVTAAMLSSGFNTKSNFNREFLRVTGSSPSDWRDTHSITPTDP